ncbi:MAG TPA: hypothetical protein VMH81_08495 [Bryobacteraceae bacterium]|nr:hypothetical protein [Bryobacteraceae bacterium]
MMLFRFTRLWVGLGLVVLLWSVTTLGRLERGGSVRPIGTRPGPVRIVQFYASVRILTAGEKALLCYGVENAKSVRIAHVAQDVYPASSRCVDIVPEQTTHYTILAEGFDGKIAVRSLILPVQAAPPPPRILSEAGFEPLVISAAE